jgi:hypothetical protein
LIGYLVLPRRGENNAMDTALQCLEKRKYNPFTQMFHHNQIENSENSSIMLKRKEKGSTAHGLRVVLFVL